MMSGSPEQSAEFPRRALSPVLTTLNIPVTFIENSQAIDSKALSQFDLYIQSGSIRITPEQEKALWDFVENGGAFLALSTAADGPQGGPYERLIGGRLMRRPAPYTYWIQATDIGKKHPIMSGIVGFEVFDEELFVRYDVDPPPPPAPPRPGQPAPTEAALAAQAAQRALVARATNFRPPAGAAHALFSSYGMSNGTDMERLYMGNGGVTQTAAGWWQEIGKGRTCYLSPGHTEEVMNHPTMQRMYLNAVRWLVRMD